MRGEDQKQEAMFSCVSPEKRVPANHPLRGMREMVDTILKGISPRLARLYSELGRPIDRAGAVVAGTTAADFLFGAERAAAGGAAAV